MRSARLADDDLLIEGAPAPTPALTVAPEVKGDTIRIRTMCLGLGPGFWRWMRRNGLATLVGDGGYDPVEEANGPRAVFSFSAVFAEVRVDPDFGLVRLNRFVGAYDAGRIINPKTARSQAIGGIIWGVGQALLEQSETDPVMGRFLDRNYSGYLMPTNADIPELDILFVGEFDEEASPLGVKGLGELTAYRSRPRSRMPSIMRPANEYATCRSPWRSCCEAGGRSRPLPEFYSGDHRGARAAIP